MMDHIRQRDWSVGRRNEKHFVDEEDIDNSCIEKILSNKFWDPLIENEEEESIVTIDWSTVFNNETNKTPKYRLFVAGYRKAPLHPKLSALTKEEHFQYMKVLSVKNKGILPKLLLRRPTKIDQKLFEEKMEIYKAEQKEYIEWAKQVWKKKNCLKALCPNAMVESVYRAEFDMKRHMMKCFSKTFILAAQIPLRAECSCEIILPKKDLVQVTVSKLPQCFYPDINQSKVSILQECALPKPCAKHPCKFKLPNENAESLLPLTEIHKELAQYAIENGADYIASENAIKCILEMDRCWTLPVSVCEVLSADGRKRNVVVLGSEFPIQKDPAPVRTYRAFKHLLLKGFTEKPAKTFADCNDNAQSPIPSGNSRRESDRMFVDCSDNAQSPIPSGSSRREFESPIPIKPTQSIDTARSSFKAANAYKNSLKNIRDKLFEASDDSDEGSRLQIDIDDNSQLGPGLLRYESDSRDMASEQSQNSTDITRFRNILTARRSIGGRRSSQEFQNKCGIFTCTCKDTEFEMLPKRSYKKLQIKNHTIKDQINILIHSSHKLKSKKSTEVILEPIIEYQLDVGGTVHSPQKLQSLAFSLMIRKKAELINVRVDGENGELVTIDTTNLREITADHGSFTSDTANVIYTTLNRLGGLLPGAYLLRHEPAHGSNAILYRRTVAGMTASMGVDVISLQNVDRVLSATEEARLVQSMPTLAPVLLPYHKFKRQLPLAFTYDSQRVEKKKVSVVIQAVPKARGRRRRKLNSGQEKKEREEEE